jgi:hypothetical protein
LASFVAASSDSGADWASAGSSRESQAALDFIRRYQQGRGTGGKAIFISGNGAVKVFHHFKESFRDVLEEKFVEQGVAHVPYAEKPLEERR